MIRPAFSTVATPHLTLEQVARKAAEWGYSGVDLRSFGFGGRELACEPGLTAPAKARRIFSDAGIDVASVSTGVRFDAPVQPPVFGHVLLDREKSVHEARRFLGIARGCGAETVRFYAYDARPRERRTNLLRRIAGRLYLVCDDARHDPMDVVIENGGAFSRAEDLLEIMAGVDHLARRKVVRLKAAYDLAAAHAAGEDPAEGVKLLRDRLALVRVRDRQGRVPCGLGEGDLPAEPFIKAVAADERTRNVWAVMMWDKLWHPAMGEGDDVLRDAVQKLYRWAGEAAGTLVESTAA